VSDKDIPIKYTYVNGYSIRYLDFDYKRKSNNNDNSQSQEQQYKKVLILLHDILFSAEIWLRIVPELSKYFRVIIPDIIGLGYSDKPRVEYTTDFFLEFLKGFIGNLGIDKFSIVGASFGVYLAEEFATIRFNTTMIEKLVLVAPSGKRYLLSDQYSNTIRHRTNYQSVYRAFRDMVFDSSVITDDIIRDFLNRMRLPNAIYAFISILLGIADSRHIKRRLFAILSPTLLIWGDNDKVIPLQYAIQYTNEIPNCTLVVISFCGHLPYVEKPLEFSNKVLKFLLD
jgi:2-hydroxy-6-oxonona-2,4-dienedioate hydrolase